MKVGFNLLLWTAHVRPEHWSLLEDLKSAGYDGVEIPIFEGDPADYAKIGRRLEQLGLDSTGIALFPSVGMNPIGDAPEQRAAALKHIDCNRYEDRTRRSQKRCGRRLVAD
jgi:D-psicose/D-tagatose/L-ribulose 3-epimerase